MSETSTKFYKIAMPELDRIRLAKTAPSVMEMVRRLAAKKDDRKRKGK